MGVSNHRVRFWLKPNRAQWQPWRKTTQAQWGDQPPVKSKGSPFHGVHFLLWNHLKEVSGQYPNSGTQGWRERGKEMLFTSTQPLQCRASPRLCPWTSSGLYLDSLPVWFLSLLRGLCPSHMVTAPNSLALLTYFLTSTLKFSTAYVISPFGSLRRISNLTGPKWRYCSSQALSQEKEIQDIQIGKGEVKYPYSHEMIIHAENPKQCCKTVRRSKSIQQSYRLQNQRAKISCISIY